MRVNGSFAIGAMAEIGRECNLLNDGGTDLSVNDQGDLARAAAALVCEHTGFGGLSMVLHPHVIEFFEAADMRAALVRAGALIALEIDRMDQNGCRWAADGTRPDVG